MKINVVLQLKFKLVKTMDNKTIAIIGAVVIIAVIIICAFAFSGQNNTDTATAAVNDTSTTGDTYQLQINASGKWRLDLTVDGKYSSDEGDVSKTIELGDSVNSASVTVNQYETGPTEVYLLKNGKVIDEGSADGDGVQTIYFYYQR